MAQRTAVDGTHLFDPRAETTMVAMLNEAARTYPDNIAMRTRAGEVVTYADMNRLSNQWAHALLSLDIKPGQVVASMLPMGVAWLGGVMAVWKAGGCHVDFDPTLPLSRLRRYIEIANVAVIVTDAANAPLAAELSEAVGVGVLDVNALASDGGDAPPNVTVTADNPALLTFTSAGSGDDKALLQSHRFLMKESLNASVHIPVKTNDTVLQLSLPSAMEVLRAILPALMVGGCVSVFNSVQGSFVHLPDWIADSGVTYLHMTPTVYRRMLQLPQVRDKLRGVRVVNLSGEPVKAADYTLYALCREFFPAETVFSWSWVTAEVGMVAFYAVDDETFDGETLPTGYALPDKDVLIWDEDGSRVAPNALGEIVIRSRYLSDGYVNDPELTASKFLIDGDDLEMRYYLTGERGRVDENRLLYHEGRSASELVEDDTLFIEAFERWVEKTPEQLAVHAYGDAPLTYAEFNRAANRVAHAVVGAGVEAGGVVACVLPNGARAIVTMIGVLKGGGCYCFLDEGLPSSRLESYVQRAGVVCFVTDAERLPLVEALADTVGAAVVNLDVLPDDTPDSNLNLDLNPDAPAVITFTSGSTGEPKIVPRTHHAIMARVNASSGSARDIATNDRGLVITLLTFALTYGRIFAPLARGASILHVDIQRVPLSKAAVWIDAEGVTYWSLLPSLFRSLLQASGDLVFKAVRIVALGGEAVTRYDVQLYQRHFPPSTVMVQTMGSSETGIYSTYEIDPDALGDDDEVIPVGYAIPNVDVMVWDEHEQPVPPGEAGEIVIRSDYMAARYVGDASRSGKKFREDPENPGMWLCFTGDLGKMRADGCLYFLGRRDSQIKLRGQLVQTAAVESHLWRLPQVQDAAVQALTQDATTGEKVLVGYVVAARGAASVTADDLRAALRDVMPDYMVPAQFVMLHELPRTATGKVDYKALPEPDLSAMLAEREMVLPRTPTETGIRDIVMEMRKTDNVSIHDDFFDLGMTSLQLANMMGIIEERMGKLLPLVTLVRNSTVADLAAVFDAQEEADWSTLLPLNPDGTRTPLFMLAGVGGGNLSFRELAFALPRDVPFYALRPPGLGPNSEPLETIEELAALYVENVRSVQPDGPYYFAGYCFGAKVAFEMAQQLKRDGEETAFIGVLDSPIFLPKSDRVGMMMAKLESYWRRLGYHLENMSKGSFAEGVAYVRERGGRFVRRWRKAEKRSENWVADGYWDDAPDIYQVVRQSNQVASRHYDPQPYDGDLIVFISETMRTQGHSAWHRLTSGKVDVHRVGGDHLSMMSGEHIKQVARVLLRAMSHPDGD